MNTLFDLLARNAELTAICFGVAFIVTNVIVWLGLTLAKREDDFRDVLLDSERFGVEEVQIAEWINLNGTAHHAQKEE